MIPQKTLTCKELEIMVLKQTIKAFDDDSPKSAAFVCRERESQYLYDLASRALTGFEIPLIRVYGPPGTGKTFTVLHQIMLISKNPLLRSLLSPWWHPESCIINGAMLHTPHDFFKSFISKTLPSYHSDDVLQVLKDSGVASALKVFKKLRYSTYDASPHKENVILVIDEVEQLEEPQNNRKDKSTSQSTNLIRNLFKLAAECRILLILISNTLPLSNTRGPYSHMKCNKADSEEFLLFQPYTANELEKILDRRITIARDNVIQILQSIYDSDILEYQMNFVESISLFAQSAKALALQRIASHQGDCRQMLETCRHLLLRKLRTYTENDVCEALELTRLNEKNVTDPLKKKNTTAVHYYCEDIGNTDDNRNVKYGEGSKHFFLLSDMSKTYPNNCNNVSESVLDIQHNEKFHLNKNQTSQEEKHLKTHRLLHFSSVNEDCSVSSESTTASPRSHNQQSVIGLHETVTVLTEKFQKSRARCHSLILSLPLHLQILTCAICMISTKSTNDNHKESYKSASQDDFMNETQHGYGEHCRTTRTGNDEASYFNDLPRTPLNSRGQKKTGNKYTDPATNKACLTSFQSIRDQYKLLCEKYNIPMEYNNTMNLNEALERLKVIGIIGDANEFQQRNGKRTPQGGKRSWQARLNSNLFNKNGSSPLIRLLLDSTDVCDVLKKSKQMFKVWLGD